MEKKKKGGGHKIFCSYIHTLYPIICSFSLYMLESISPFLESKLALLLLWDERCGRSYTVPALRINLQMPYSQGLPWKTCPTTTSTRLSKNLPGGKIAMALTTLSSMRQSANPHKHSYFTDCRCVNEPN